MLASGPTVQRLRVHAPGAGSAEAARAQRVARQWLEDLAPTRYGLQAQAIVVVRQVQTRLPALVPGSPWPDPLLPLLRGAARPALQPAAGAAVAAVWFSDEAELLACLARDVLAARPAWWWPVLLGRQPDAALATARWCRTPTQLPRAWQQLPAGEGVAWLQAMGPGGRGELQRALRSAFAVGDAVHTWLVSGERAPSRSSLSHDTMRSDAATSTDAVPAQGTVAASARLNRLLLALALDAMAAATSDHAATWCPELTAANPPPAAPFRDATGAVAGGAVSAPTATVAAPPPTPPIADAKLQQNGHGAWPEHPTWAGSEAAVPGRAQGPAAVWPVDAERQRLGSPPTHHLAAPPPAAAAHPESFAQPAPEVAFDTRFGGLFFLVNVALAMDLYGDFTQPRTIGLAHTPWQFLYALGARWAGAGWRSDPLSRWLQARAATQPWPRLACAQLAPAAARPSPAGVSGPAPERPAPPDRLGGLAPRLAQRLALALGLPRSRPAIALTLRLPARLIATPGRVDLHFTLAALPLALRLAGIDRDPGWVPAAGCDFRFHFH